MGEPTTKKVCPHCGSKNIKMIGASGRSGDNHQKMKRRSECKDCGKEFRYINIE